MTLAEKQMQGKRMRATASDNAPFPPQLAGTARRRRAAMAWCRILRSPAQHPGMAILDQ